MCVNVNSMTYASVSVCVCMCLLACVWECVSKCLQFVVMSQSNCFIFRSSSTRHGREKNMIDTKWEILTRYHHAYQITVRLNVIFSLIGGTKGLIEIFKIPYSTTVFDMQLSWLLCVTSRFSFFYRKLARLSQRRRWQIPEAGLAGGHGRKGEAKRTPISFVSREQKVCQWITLLSLELYFKLQMIKKEQQP